MAISPKGIFSFIGFLIATIVRRNRSLHTAISAIPHHQRKEENVRDFLMARANPKEI